jgi:hypothetical protein
MKQDKTIPEKYHLDGHLGTIRFIALTLISRIFRLSAQQLTRILK